MARCVDVNQSFWLSSTHRPFHWPFSKLSEKSTSCVSNMWAGSLATNMSMEMGDSVPFGK